METYITCKKIDDQWDFTVWLRETQIGTLYQARGGMGEMGGEVLKGEIYRVGVLPEKKFCKTIILQLNK